jgi:hypothetical protein
MTRYFMTVAELDQSSCVVDQKNMALPAYSWLVNYSAEGTDQPSLEQVAMQWQPGSPYWTDGEAGAVRLCVVNPVWREGDLG